MEFYGVICHYINMKMINDSQRLKAYLAKYDILSHFSDSNLPFSLYQFEKGETINNRLDPRHYITFVVSGTLKISNIREDGSVSDITAGSGFTCLGDVEFATGSKSPYLIEVMRRTTCIVLPLDSTRDKLEKDPIFLTYLLRSVSEKLNRVTAMAVEPKDLRERILHYIRTECPDNRLAGVEKTAGVLHCSKRQLLRHLKALCDEGILIRTGKGEYSFHTQQKIEPN